MQTKAVKVRPGKSRGAWSQVARRDYIIIKPGTNIALSRRVFDDPLREEKGYVAGGGGNCENAQAEAGRLGGVVASAAWVRRKFGKLRYECK